MKNKIIIGSFVLSNSFFLKILFTYFQREGKGGRKREKYQCVVASHVAPTGDLANNPDMCPDWESNLWPFGSQAGIQSTEPHLPGAAVFIFLYA